MGHFLWLTFYKIRDSFRPHAALACESMEEILLKQVKKEEDLDVQTAETIDKAPILNLFEILQQTTFLEKDQHDDDKINCLLNLFASLLHYKYTISSNLYMKK